MEHKEHSQLELFCEIAKKKRAADIQNATKSFFNYMRSYEKAILVIIIAIVTSIVSFSLGVEKGKRLASVNPVSVIAPKIEKPVNTQPFPQDASNNNYTIQVASYKSRASAEKEAEALKKRGLSPLVLAKDKYIVVCVGEFFSKENAQSLLPKLKKRYQDCFIRRL